MKFRFNDGRDWFFEKRFGLFIHWGIYAIPAWHEQHIYRKHLTRKEYVPLMKGFKPDKFNPEEWLDQAQEAGMSYLCFTTKHLDGFCMWDSDETDFKITNTPYGLDTLRLLAEACHRRDFPLCLYYSVPDSHQPNYPHAGRHYEFPSPQPGDQPDEEKYIDFVKRQIKELCTRYGKIHGFWWDANVLKRHDPSINALIREFQPGIIINNRGMDAGDFGTPERDWDESVNSLPQFEKPVEACQSIGYQSWSYRKDEDYYSDAHLIGSIQKILAKDGNYLLNIGPKADGSFSGEAKSILKRVGEWFHCVEEALIGGEPANEFTGNREVLVTRRANTLYVHIFKEPATSAINLHPIIDIPFRATLLNTGEKVEVAVRALPWLHDQKPNHCLSIVNLPVNSKPLCGSVVKLEFDKLAVNSSNLVVDTDKTFLKM